MPQTVQIGGDTLQFPDGMSDADIQAAIRKEYGSKPSAPSALTQEAPAPVAPQAPANVDQGLGFAMGLKRPLDNAAVMASHISVIGPAIDNLAGPENRAQAVLDRDNAQWAAQAKAENARPGTAGNIAGSVVSSIPLLFLTKNPWIVGAMQGGLNTSNPNDPKAVVADTAMGAGLGKAGDLGVKAAGAVIAPKLNPMVQQLLKSKVELTPGQVLGGMAHRLEDAGRTLFGTGDMIIGSQANAQRSFAKASVQKVLDPIQENLPKNLVDGHAQVAYAGDKLSQGYKAVLDDIDRVAPGKQTGVRIDPTFSSSMLNLRNLTRGLGADQRNTFNQIVQQQIQPAFNRQTGVASGASLKTVDEFLGKQARDFASSSNPYDRQLSSALVEAQAQIRDLIGRQFPAHAAQLENLNEGWAKLIRVEQAAKGAKGGNFTPEQLRQAVVNQATGVRGRSAARGEALLQDFADSGSRVMSSTVPDSGTGTRMLATGLTGLAVNGGGFAFHPNPWAIGALATMAAPYVNRTTGAIARGVIAARPAGAQAVRHSFEMGLRRPAQLAAPIAGKGMAEDFQ
jgi:hypothetical protein